jgi:UDP-glucuronate 4-epimerase
MSKILLTGCAGFIGHHLTGYLLDQGHRVIGVDNLDDFYNPNLKRQNLATIEGRPNFTFVYGDILNKETQHHIFRDRPETVIHLAGRAGVRPSVQHPELYIRNNIQATSALLQQAAQSHVEHFLFASSSSVYGNPEKTPFSEDDPVDKPVSPYAATKRACEIISHAFHHLHGLSVSALRFFTVYGPRQRPEMAFSLFANSMLRNQPITLFGEGTERDYTYIDDIVRGVELVMNKPLGYSIVNLGNSQPVPLDKVVATLEDVIGLKAHIERAPLPPGDVQRTYADLTKATEVYGYKPQTSLEEGLTRFADSLRP